KLITDFDQVGASNKNRGSAFPWARIVAAGENRLIQRGCYDSGSLTVVPRTPSRAWLGRRVAALGGFSQPGPRRTCKAETPACRHVARVPSAACARRYRGLRSAG